MNCLIILLLLACGGGFGCGCGNMERGNMCCQRRRDREDDCPCSEDRGPVRCPQVPGDHDCCDRHDHDRHDHDCDDHHDHHDREGRQGGPAAWNNFPSISGGETCGCDAE